jgi:hypothetical protein
MRLEHFAMALACVLALPAPGGASAACTAAQKYGQVKFQYGGPGGAAWSDEQLAVYGPITKIEIWGGRYVDAVRVTYGAYLGPLHGGGGNMPGGSPQTIQLAAGESITAIDGQAGTYVDNICFTKNTQQRICAGGGGGGAFQANEAGKPLRYLTGRSGVYVDKIGGAFANFSDIDPGTVRSDTAAMLQSVQQAQDKVITQTLVNDLDVPQRQKVDERQAVASNSSANWSNSQTITQQHQVGGEISYTPPSDTGGAGGKVSYSYTNTQSSSSSSGGSTSDTTSQSIGVVVNVTVPAHSRIVATTSWKQMSYNIPVYFDVLYFSDATKTQVLCREPVTSMLQGVQSFGVKTTWGPG